MRNVAHLRRFDGFPYITTRVEGAMHHVIALPDGFSEGALPELARAQLTANRLPTCLVLSNDRAVYFDAQDNMLNSRTPPCGGILVTDALAASIEFLDSSELRTKQERLREFAKQRRPSKGFMLGDLTKGGRRATNEERAFLEGAQKSRAPRGLQHCEHCREWRGICLDPAKTCRGQVMNVSCRCDNHNRCARCLRPLYERRLNANYYEPGDGQIWHVPGFCGLSHECVPSAREFARAI